MKDQDNNYEGSHDFSGATLVGGWARNASAPDIPVTVDIYVDDRLCASVRADQFRQDLFEAGRSEGCCAFVFEMPKWLRDGNTHMVYVKIAGSDFALSVAPSEVFCPLDLSESLPRRIMEDVVRMRVTAQPAVFTKSGKRFCPPQMKINIICYEDLEDWILGKIANELCQSLTKLGMEVGIDKRPDPSADINHHIIYWGYVDEKATVETIMITHIDNYRELGKVRQQLVDLNVEMGICMSFEAVHRLAHFGVPRHKLCYVHPAQDGIIRPRKLLVGITSRVYPDGCKREHLLQELAPHIAPDQFKFAIMGAGWEKVVDTLGQHKIEVDYTDHFDYSAYCKLIPSLDYYLYTGLDEGSMGFLDAVAAAVPTIVSPQGYHLDVSGGITHAFTDLATLVRVFSTIAEERAQRTHAVLDWTWEENARRHVLIWHYLLCKERGEFISKALNDELSELGVVDALNG